jgi:hypothetical protein
LAISGWLLAQRPHPVGRWPAKRLAKKPHTASLSDDLKSNIQVSRECLNVLCGGKKNKVFDIFLSSCRNEVAREQKKRAAGVTSSGSS